MPTLADVVHTHRADYQAQHSLSFLERKTLEALLACRSGSLGSTLYQCADCGQKHFIHRSCGNRHCPQCQQHKTRQWVLNQQSRQLPVPYFLLTFTVPQPLRRFLRSHKRPGYEALFHASSQALKKLARDPRLLGSDLAGFTGVLHTWGRQLQYHPHIHYLVPAGAVSCDRKHWLATPENFFLPVQALSVIFRAKFRHAIDQAGLLDRIPAQVWQQPWVVHCQPAGDGTRALQYLARYVFRVAIANSRILELKQGRVTFSFRDKKTGQSRRVRLSAVEFIRRFLDHLLPSGFQKVRHYGFFSPTCAVSIDRIRLLIAQKTGRPLLLDLSAAEPAPGPFCPHCGGRLRVLAIQLPTSRFLDPPPLANTG
jgi:putative transposase/transposase-like zinc-binding protein